jgi:hypothetical protein
MRLQMREQRPPQAATRLCNRQCYSDSNPSRKIALPAAGFTISTSSNRANSEVALTDAGSCATSSRSSIVVFQVHCAGSTLTISGVENVCQFDPLRPGVCWLNIYKRLTPPLRLFICYDQAPIGLNRKIDV